MGLSSTTWFVIAVIIVLLGVGLLFVDRKQKSGGAAVKDRRRWAALRGWEFLDTDPVLPSRWRYGTIHQGGPGVAKNLISGEVPLPDGARQAYIFDHEQAGRVTSVLAATRRGRCRGGAGLRVVSGLGCAPWASRRRCGSSSRSSRSWSARRC